MLSVFRCKSLTCWFLLLLLGGCSISYSGGKSSDSVSAGLDSVSASLDSLTSISTSSTDSGAELAATLRLYMEDVSGLTRLYLRDGGTQHAFQQDLGVLAESYDIPDWQAEPATYRAIGAGLRAGSPASKRRSPSFLPPVPAEFSSLVEGEEYRS